jgi:hypothetical protein
VLDIKWGLWFVVVERIVLLDGNCVVICECGTDWLCWTINVPWAAGLECKFQSDVKCAVYFGVKHWLFGR